MSRISPVVLVALCALTPPLTAQPGPPAPAPELKKFAPLEGNWSGSGTAIMDPAQGPTKWTCEASYRWSHGGYFMQEDTVVRFESMPTPMVFRAYFGWDQEKKRYVNVSVNNEGGAKLAEVDFLPDGTMLQVLLSKRKGAHFAERARTKVAGDKMQFTMDFLMAAGPSTEAVTGTLSRTGKVRRPVLASTPAMQAPDPEMTKLGRMAGTYLVKGSMIMMPGTPSMKIRGTDKVTPIFAGTILHVHTDGEAEGMPEKYEADTFFAWDPARRCFVNVMVSNMGEIGEMESRFIGNNLVTAGAMPMMGQPTAMRFIFELDAAGAILRATGHSLVGTHPPFESFNATYTKK